MRELHVLGVSDDGDTVLLGTTAEGKVTHQVALDGRLRQAVRGQLTSPGTDRAESALSPKEIQARLRAGASPEEVAKIAGVPVARVLPFFAPVEAERLRIVEEARQAMLHRARGPESTRALGELADARLREVAGLKEDSVTWTARRRSDGTWIVGVVYVARGGRRRAEWLWKPAVRELTALDSMATRIATEAAAVPTRRRTAARKKPAAKKAVAKKAAPKKAAPKKAVAKKAVAKKTAPKKAAVKKTVAKKTVVKRAAAAPAKKAVKPAPKKAVVNRKTAAEPPRRRRVLEVVPDPVEITPPAAAAGQEGTPRRPGARVPLPSWSDVLLGVGGAAAPAGEPTRRGRPRRGRRS